MFYVIRPSGATGNRLSNDNITYVNGTLAVTKARLTITALSYDKPYGTSIVIGYRQTGLVTANGDTISSISLSSNFGANDSAPPGNYPTIARNAVGAGLGNYNIDYVQGKLVVYA